MQLNHNRPKLSDTKTCAKCGRDLHETYPHDLCPACMEFELFNAVKEYIRSNDDVHEQDVAEEFDIPISKVRGWIREGRIQYKGDNSDKLSSVVCKMCGKKIAFGTLCPQCHSLQQLQVVSNFKKQAETAGEMHFLNKKEQ